MTCIQPIHDVPALRVNNSVAIGDLHIGVETHLFRKGFHLESRTWNMYDAIMDMDDDISRLIVIGDVKDSVPGSSRQEYREIPDFFEKLLERFDIIDVVRGNHDTNIEEFLPRRVRVSPASGLVVDDVGFVHGHTWPSDKVMRSSALVMAHNHPTVMFMDDIGRTSTEPCWLRGGFVETSEKYLTLPKTFIVIPAFNRMLGGSPINVRNESLLGPILNSDIVDLDNAHIFLMDGIDLGTRKSLMIENRKKRD